MTDDSAGQVDAEILEGLGEVFASLLGRAEQISQRLGVPVFFLKAMHRLDCPLAMKELGQRLRCDPSFVTGIADLLEKRGLATRESDPADRRIKRLRLTPAGIELRQRIENEILDGLPWRDALDDSERACLLSHIRKIASAAGLSSPGESRIWEEVSQIPVQAAGHPVSSP